MTDLEKNIRKAVKEFIANDEAFADNVQLEINTLTLQVAIADPDQDLPDCDYYQMMDLVNADMAHPGKWSIDDDAIAEVVADYIVG